MQHLLSPSRDHRVINSFEYSLAGINYYSSVTTVGGSTQTFQCLYLVLSS